MNQIQQPWWQSSLFYGALLLGPVCWVGMNLSGIPFRESAFRIGTFLLVVLVAPILEEIVFRGGIQEFLQQRLNLRRQFAQISLANILTSIIFSAFHIFSQPLIWALLIFFPSLVFGWAKDRFQSLAAPMVLHATYNAGFIFFYGKM